MRPLLLLAGATLALIAFVSLVWAVKVAFTVFVLRALGISI